MLLCHENTGLLRGTTVRQKAWCAKLLRTMEIWWWIDVILERTLAKYYLQNEPRAIRTLNLLIWSQTRYHCAIGPTINPIRLDKEISEEEIICRIEVCLVAPVPLPCLAMSFLRHRLSVCFPLASLSFFAFLCRPKNKT